MPKSLFSLSASESDGAPAAATGHVPDLSRDTSAFEAPPASAQPSPAAPPAKPSPNGSKNGASGRGYGQLSPKSLGNQYEADRVLKSYLRRVLPAGVHRAIEPEVREVGRLAGEDLYRMQAEDRLSEPELQQYNAWGDRADEIKLTRVWQEARRLAAEHGLVAAAYEQHYGAFSRIYQMAMAYLLAPATDMIAFPLAMTDGAARTILASGNQAIIDEAVPRLTSRDPERFWISGQWKTERSGGSDLRKAQTTAEPDGDGTWRLYGHKWFTSSIISNVALVLGRAEGAPEGYEGLALFYVPVRPDGDLVEGLRVDRLKDKLGARKLPCAELTLDGVRGVPLVGLSHGVQHIAPMLTITRTWTSLASCGIMRRGLALVRDFSQKRTAFGQPIIEKPLHYDTLANLQATFEGAFHLTFRLVELIGQDEAGRLSDDERLLLRLLSPMVKLTTAKQAVSVASEIVELFGGAGYVEDTGIPKLIRDAQVLPIWEGTTNVMALIMLRLMKQIGNLDPLRREFDRCAEAVESDSMRHVMSTARAAFDSALGWLSHAIEEGPAAVEAGARRFALTLGHALELALMARHAQWAMHHEDSRAAIAAERLATQGIDFITPRYSFDAYTLAKDVAKQSLFDTGSHQTP